MAIEVICKGCARKLRVGDENAGKLARCPSCGETFTVPQGPGAISPEGLSGTAPTQAPGSSPPEARWYLKTEDGVTYGPASKAELDAWVAEGRVTAESQLLREGETYWQPARQVYPALAMGALGSPAHAPPVASGNPYADAPAPQVNPYASPTYGAGGGVLGTGMIGGRYVQPHRGGVILTLGILGMCLCGFLGIAAVVMANEDLKLMSAGRMDASGKAMTTVGMVLGIISIVLMVLYMAASFLGNIK